MLPALLHFFGLYRVSLPCKNTKRHSWKQVEWLAHIHPGQLRNIRDQRGYYICRYKPGHYVSQALSHNHTLAVLLRYALISRESYLLRCEKGDSESLAL